MARESNQTQPATGRTAWDALVEISNRFAPIILIVAVAAWGFYEYRKSDQAHLDKLDDMRMQLWKSDREHMAKLDEARAQSYADYREELTRLNDALIKTYQTMQGITDARIEKFGTMLDLGDQVVVRMAALSEKEEKQKRQIDESQRKLEALNTAIRALTKEKETLEIAFENNMDDLKACNVATIALSPEPVAGSTGELDALWMGKLGALSAKYEVEGRSPGTVLSGIGDAGGVSYGSYMMTSRPRGGTVGRFVAHAAFPWRERFAGLEPGSPAFSEQWKALAEEAPEAFFEAQHDFIKQTHYDPLVRKIEAEDGIDIDERSRTLQDAIWSTAVQHGPNTPVVHRALAKLRADGAIGPEDKGFDEELVKAIYAERSRKNAAGDLVYFSRNSLAVQEGVRKRHDEELRNALENLSLERKQAG